MTSVRKAVSSSRYRIVRQTVSSAADRGSGTDSPAGSEVDRMPASSLVFEAFCGNSRPQQTSTVNLFVVLSEFRRELTEFGSVLDRSSTTACDSEASCVSTIGPVSEGGSSWTCEQFFGSASTVFGSPFVFGSGGDGQKKRK